MRGDSSTRKVPTSRRPRLTFTVDGDVARWVRAKSAQENTSMARLVSELLRWHMLEDAAYERAMKQHLSQKPVSFGKRRGYPSRDEMYDR